jgi:hypothetical protein
MTDVTLDPRYLEIFPQWLRSLGEDASAVGQAIGAAGGDDDATRWLVSGLNYIFKSLDLIPDGIDDLGYLDDAFVLRLACASATTARPELKQGALASLSDDAGAVRTFLEDDAPRLEAYVAGLRKGAARGRTVEDIVRDEGVRGPFLEDVRAWAASYKAPSFVRDPKTIVKLKSFLSARLA